MAGSAGSYISAAASGSGSFAQSVSISDGGVGSPAYIKIYDDAGVPWYLFVDTSGRWRIHNAIPTSNNDGIPTGQQTIASQPARNEKIFANRPLQAFIISVA